MQLAAHNPVPQPASSRPGIRSYASVHDLVRYTYGRYGWQGFYRGMAPCMLFTFPRGLSRFYTYETILQVLRSCKESGPYDEYVA
jgi:hypothetical protein